MTIQATHQGVDTIADYERFFACFSKSFCLLSLFSGQSSTRTTKPRLWLWGFPFAHEVVILLRTLSLYTRVCRFSFCFFVFEHTKKVLRINFNPVSFKIFNVRLCRSNFVYIGEYDPPCDDHLALWVGFLLEARTPARPNKDIATSTGKKKGSSRVITTSPRRGNGPGVSGGRWKGPAEGWMTGEVFLVNPTEVMSTEGVQRYPKGTFGIR